MSQNDIFQSFGQNEDDAGYGVLFERLQSLMRYRIRDILLVSSMYDLYVFEEDGRLYELIREEYRGLSLSHAPELTRVSSGKKALDLAREERRFDLIITTPHIEDMAVATFARRVRDSDLNIPIVLLAYEERGIAESVSRHETSLFDRVFIWQGDFRIIIGIIKHIEDSLNAEHDTRNIGVQTILLIEDSVRYYSTFLPIIYNELFKQSTRLISEGINLSDKYLRLRARPKILLCTNYEDAWYNYQRYKEYILGIISDIDFERDGKQDKEAGIELARNVRKDQHDIPILLQSKRAENKELAQAVGASFLLKDSPRLIKGLRKFMEEQFGFGDFIFRTRDGRQVGRADNLYALEKQILRVPDESIRYHAEHNHFSKWLKARTEFWVAHKIRPKRVSEFKSMADLRKLIIDSLREYSRIRQRGSITDFNASTYDPEESFARIGGGSLGGKARGLSFVNLLITNFNIQNSFEGVEIYVPAGIVLGADVFDEFIERNDLRDFGLSNKSDELINERFINAPRFPEDARNQLKEFLRIMDMPLAVRSSSLLEDSQYLPFAGVYETVMLPNRDADISRRLEELLIAIKLVYASTFYKRVKDYIKVTSYRLEEEKMAVIVQKMVGATFENRFYPHFAGAAKSYNYYPSAPQTTADGICSVALGLGKTVADGGNCVRFSPNYPSHVAQFSTVEGTLNNNQNEFFALDLDADIAADPASFQRLVKPYDLSVAEKDGSLYHAGSTYSPENDQVYDGISRAGARLVTLAPVLKNKIFPLPGILKLLLEIGRKGMGTPVEVEFAVNMKPQSGQLHEFGVLQLRPLVLRHESSWLNIDDTEDEMLICRSDRVLGNGIQDDIFDVIVVDYETFERACSRDVAAEVATFNKVLLAERRPYLLIGVGRWGTMDPWLGIPVKWEQINGARVIVEAGFKDFDVMPSQGSHFFQNLTSAMIGYFTVSAFNETSMVDWQWLEKADALDSKKFTRHLRFENPITVKMNGQNQKGIIEKPHI